MMVEITQIQEIRVAEAWITANGYAYRCPWCFWKKYVRGGVEALEKIRTCRRKGKQYKIIPKGAM